MKVRERGRVTASEKRRGRVTFKRKQNEINRQMDRDILTDDQRK